MILFYFFHDFFLFRFSVFINIYNIKFVFVSQFTKHFVIVFLSFWWISAKMNKYWWNKIFFLINNNWITFTVVFHFLTFVTENRSTHNDSFYDKKNIQHVNYFLQIYLFDPSVWHSNSDLWRNSDDCFCGKIMIYHDRDHNHDHDHDQKMSFKNIVISSTNHFFVDCVDFISEIIH